MVLRPSPINSPHRGAEIWHPAINVLPATMRELEADIATKRDDAVELGSALSAITNATIPRWIAKPQQQPIKYRLWPPSNVSPAWLWHNTQLRCWSSHTGAARVQHWELLVCVCLCLCSVACVLDKTPRLRISINIHWQRLHIQSHGERERGAERKWKPGI